MSLRRIAALMFALVAACAKDVSPESSPAFVDYSVFDPSAGAIPLPNDLALASVAALEDGAQKDLLLGFVAAGGFPNDIEVPITIDFTRVPVGAGAASAPALDLASIRPPGTTHADGPTVALFRVDVFPPQPAAYAVAGQATSGTRTTLTLRAPAASATDATRNWVPGAQYALAVRGGPRGVKTADGHAIHPMAAMYLLLQGKNLADPANQALLPDPSLGAQLEQIRQNYLPVFSVVDAVFSSSEIANVQTFEIAPSAGAYVRVDQTAGVVPLPFDLLRTDGDGTVVFNTGFGPAAVGIDTLDGFSTTAMMLAPTSGPIDAGTVTGNVHLFKLAPDALPALVSDLAGALAAGQPGQAVYVTQPPDINQACGSASGSCSTVIGLQPAVPAPVPGLGTFYLPPLDEDTEYAVVVTTGVKSATGAALVRSTVAKVLLDVAHPVSVDGASQLAGIGDEAAAMLERMRERLGHVFVRLPGGKTKADVAMAYTFKTQSVTGVSLQLSALPYSIEQGAGAAVFSPASATVLDVTATYGIPKGPDVDAFYSVTVPSLDAIDPGTGALRPDLATLTPAQMAALVKPLPALVAVPLATNPNLPSCPAPVASLKCAKVVIFEHGLGGGHLQMIGFANALAARGFVAAAVDFPLHGDRAYCSTAADCNTGGTCDLIPGGAGQGDTSPPGVCSNGNKLSASLTSVASGRYFVTANFFRIRDAFRQNLVDQSALALAMARPPFPLAYQPAANPLASALLAKGIVIDPSAVYVEGISLGGIAGTQVLATNPRVTRAALSVPGGTVTDVFTTAPAFTAQVDALFLSLGIDRGQIATDPAVAAKYLQTLSVAKWILDPGDPVNFAKHVITSPLPDLLSATPALQAPKEVWAQLAQGDTVVPNPYNRLLFADGAIPFTTYTRNGGDAPHGMLAVSARAQSDAAGWLYARTNPGAAVDLTDIP